MQDDLRKAHEEKANKSPLLDRVDLILALCIIAVCAGLFYVTTTFGKPGLLLGQNVLPADFPQILLVIISGLAALLPFEHRVEVRRWKKIKEMRSEPIIGLTWMTMVFLFVAVLGAPYIGTILTMLAICLLLPPMWGERRWWLILPYAVIFTALVSYVFSVLLQVYFEPGIFNVRW